LIDHGRQWCLFRMCLYVVACIVEWFCNFFGGSGVAFDQNRLIFIFAILSSLLLLLFLIVSAFFNHDTSCLQLSPFIWMFLVMELLLVMDLWLSEDVSVFWFVYFDSIIVDGVSNCCCRSALPLLRFIVVTLFIHLALLLYSTMGLLLFTKWTVLLYSPFCWSNLDPYFMLRAFVSIVSINLKFFLTVAFYYLLQPSFANIILSLFILSDWGSFCFGALIYLFFFRIGILFTACSVSSSTNGIISFLSTTVCLLNRPCPRSQISMPHPITKNCIPKCRLLGTRPVSV
jgi:hypothetical protein